MESARRIRPGEHLSIGVILLSIFLPSAIAQNPNSPANNPSQTTLQTVTSPTPTSNTPPPATTTSSNDDPVTDHIFNYYFLIIAAAVVVLGVGLLLIRGRKQRKAALNRSRSQRALAQDLAGFSQRFGVGRGGVVFSGGHTRQTSSREEGLDDRGEAPPPYVPGSKPPSLRSTDGIIGVTELSRSTSSRDEALGDVVEMGNMGTTTMREPPAYNVIRPAGAGLDSGLGSETDLADMARPTGPAGHSRIGTLDLRTGQLVRPDSAVIASERFESSRQLLRNGNNTDSTS